jgi:UDP-glucose 4-epimerase
MEAVVLAASSDGESVTPAISPEQLADGAAQAMVSETCAWCSPSTAATYGEPANKPGDRSHRATNPARASSPGRALRCSRTASHASLRYQAAGASERSGEHHDPETHLIPLVLQAAAGTRPAVTVFGEDYPTPDGTCVRDYVHVIDLARAHVAALAILSQRSAIYNLGCGGDGYPRH